MNKVGLTIREMLLNSNFQDYKLLAGGKGVDKKIQGIAIMDAPDGYRWTRGRELVVCSGYILKENLGLLYELLEEDVFKKASGLAIKCRYIEEIPGDVIQKFEDLDIPLILVPEEVGWMTLANNLNVIVMNKSIQQFDIGQDSPKQYKKSTYRGHKIEKVLSQIENEMGFPGMLYDLSRDVSYYSSPKFTKLADKLNIHKLYEPKEIVSKEVLCNNLPMIRYRYHDDRYEIPYSWIVIPIIISNQIHAYFILMEATGLIDYFDEFSIRIGFLILKSLYERTYYLDTMGNYALENLMREIVSGQLENPDLIKARANELYLDISTQYWFLNLTQTTSKMNLSSHKKDVSDIVWKVLRGKQIKTCFINENHYVIMLPFKNQKLILEKPEDLLSDCNKIIKELENKMPSFTFRIGIPKNYYSFEQLRLAYNQATQALDAGQYLFPDADVVSYADLGPFAWFNINHEELDDIVTHLEMVLGSEDSKELLKTLKNYIQCNMNYSQTAKQMFLHINTVRNRIEKINSLLNIQVEDPINRLKLELVLTLAKIDGL